MSNLHSDLEAETALAGQWFDHLRRQSKSRLGVPVAILIAVTCAIMFYYTVVADWQAAVFWVAIVAAIALYDFFVVPRTPRGRLYREELLRMVDTGRALSGESGRIAA